MKILHYSLGFPPYRSGGLTKYSTDLMKSQVSQGHEVSLLWPGRINILKRSSKIKKNKDYLNINSYELINPLYIPLLNGINSSKQYTKSVNSEFYRRFLKKINPEVIHIHTLMGIHEEFFQVAKEMKIKMVYTSHDYFGICPKVNLLFNGKPCDGNNYEECAQCNIDALSMWKIIVLQSKVYRYIKTSKVIKKVRYKYKVKTNKVNRNYKKLNNSCDYKELRRYYYKIFKYVDIFHFNSQNTYQIYSKYLSINKFKIISITHADIKNNKVIKRFDEELKLTYLGPTVEYKGYNLLKKSLDNLYNKGIEKFRLNIYSYENEDRKYMNKNEEYEYKDLEKIFNDTDLLIVPSICYETFGFVVIEALSYGVPVLVSSNVGAKDIVIDGITGSIVEPNVESIEKKILEYYNERSILINQNKNIVDYNYDFSIINHMKKLMEQCYN